MEYSRSYFLILPLHLLSLVLVAIALPLPDSLLLEETPPVVVGALLPQGDLDVVALQRPLAVGRQDPAVKFGHCELKVLAFVVIHEQTETPFLKGALDLVAIQKTLGV